MQTNFKNIIYGNKKDFFSTVTRFCLWQFSLLYKVILLCLRRVALNHSKKLPCITISIGNITWGGTGKTPLVDLIVEYLLSKKNRVAVLMRGVGADEDAFLRLKHPEIDVVSGKDRYKNGVSIFKKNPVNIFVLDDGFQQWAIKRDFDIVTINSIDPWGPGFLIPRGALREPIDSLKRTDVVILTNSNLVSSDKIFAIKDKVSNYITDENIFLAEHKPNTFYQADNDTVFVDYNEIKGKQVVCFSGIGSPDSFESGLVNLGIEVIKHFRFDDHYHYHVDDLVAINKYKNDFNAYCVITTEKDLMRNRLLVEQLVNPLVMSIKMEIVGGNERLFTRLDRVLVR